MFCLHVLQFFKCLQCLCDFEAVFEGSFNILLVRLTSTHSFNLISQVALQGIHSFFFLISFFLRSRRFFVVGNVFFLCRVCSLAITGLLDPIFFGLKKKNTKPTKVGA